MVNLFFFSSNTWQMMTFLNPLDALISKIPFPFFFCRIFGPGHLRGLGVSLGRIFGGPSIEPFLGEGVFSQRAVSNPPPPPETRCACDTGAYASPVSVASWPRRRKLGEAVVQETGLLSDGNRCICSRR